MKSLEKNVFIIYIDKISSMCCEDSQYKRLMLNVEKSDTVVIKSIGLLDVNYNKF